MLPPALSVCPPVPSCFKRTRMICPFLPLVMLQRQVAGERADVDLNESYAG
jgi:hypothetical protein